MLFLIGTGTACIEQGPLFPPEEVIAEAGAAPEPALGGADPGGAAGAASNTAAVAGGDDAGVTVSEAAPPLPEQPSDEPPGCDASDASAPPSCGAPLPGDEAPPPGGDCYDCLAGVCPQTIERCDDTEGCGAIVACARESGCVQDECYCGDVNALLCTTTGQANGPCRDVMLAAPGAHLPNLVEPNAGPASVAASDVGACRLESDDCDDVCEN